MSDNQQGFPTMEACDEFAGAWPDVLDELAPPGVLDRANVV